MVIRCIQSRWDNKANGMITCNRVVPDNEISREMKICFQCEQRQIDLANERREWAEFH